MTRSIISSDTYESGNDTEYIWIRGSPRSTTRFYGKKEKANEMQDENQRIDILNRRDAKDVSKVTEALRLTNIEQVYIRTEAASQLRDSVFEQEL